MFVLDTNVVSELRKAHSGPADAHVLAWAEGVNAADLYISTITILEIEQGVMAVERKDTRQGGLLRRWLEQQVLPEFQDRTLAVDIAVARLCARLHVPNRKSERDALITACALVHGMTVVTRNTADFEAMDVGLLNPWLFQEDLIGR